MYWILTPFGGYSFSLKITVTSNDEIFFPVFCYLDKNIFKFIIELLNIVCPTKNLKYV